MVAEVIINSTAKQLNRVFDYNIPKELEDRVFVGSKVLVSFGNMKTLEEAYVVKIKESSSYKIKDIAKVEDNLTEEQIDLAKWMARRYFCNVSDCIKLMLAPGTRTKNKENRINDKIINCVYLKKSIEEIEFDLEKGILKSEKQKKIIQFVKDNEGCTVPEIEMFTDCSRAIVKTLEKNGYLEIIEKKINRNPLSYKELQKTNKLTFTAEQQNAYKEIEKSIINKRYEQFLLYGITGSRKNRSIFTTNRKSIKRR